MRHGPCRGRYSMVVACFNASNLSKTTPFGAIGSWSARRSCGHGPGGRRGVLPCFPFALLFQKAGLGLASPSRGEPYVPAAKNILVAPMNWGRTASTRGPSHSRRRSGGSAGQRRRTAELCSGAMCSPGLCPIEIPPVQAIDGRWVRTTVNTDDHGVMDISLIQECAFDDPFGGCPGEFQTMPTMGATSTFIAEDRIQAVWSD